MTEYHRFYDFRIADEVVGFFEIHSTAEQLYQRAKFRTGGDLSNNEFDLRIEEGDVIAFRTHSDSEWTSMTDYQPGAYPSSAFPILVPRANPEFRYRPIVESSGEVGEARVLRRDGNTVVESVEGEVVRSFTMEDGIPASPGFFDSRRSPRNGPRRPSQTLRVCSVPVEIDWGGATSRLVEDRETVIRNAPVDY